MTLATPSARLPRTLCAATLLSTLLGAALAAPPATPLEGAARHQIVDTLVTRLPAVYIFPEVGVRVAGQIRDKAAQGGYDGDKTVEALAEDLTKDLRQMADDRHFRIEVVPDFKESPPDAHRVPSAAEAAEMRADIASRAYGVNRVQRLPGNIGYIDVRGFGPLEFVAPAYAQAMSLLTGSEALVIDLRRNGGGQPEAVAGLLSHFFAVGDDRHLNSMYSRADNRTRESWTSPAASPRYEKPVYVLTSKFTFSGGEECAYDFQTQKRATLVGEVTGGGANAGDLVSLGHDVVVFIPNSRPINPVTGTNWEHVGVKPDVPTSAADAMKTAYVAALNARLKTATDPEEKDNLHEVLANVDKGIIELPGYVPPRR